jgi:tetratricopeptide (TPR) repeat protein
VGWPRWFVGVVLTAGVYSGSALGSDADDLAANALAQLSAIENDMASVRTEFERARAHQPSVERRIARGQLLKETGDREAAIAELSKVCELHHQGRASELAYADALFLLAETYFEDEQYLSAKRHFEALVEHGQRSPYSVYAGRSLARLVDVALRSGHVGGLEWVFEQIARLPADDPQGSLRYARAKAHFARSEWSDAVAEASRVPRDSPLAHQATYLRGVTLMKQALIGADDGVIEPAKLRPAIEAFREVVAIPATHRDERHVVDLAWMAMGRLAYESKNFVTAVEAYSHVDRKSPEFGDTLYELGWVYIRMGDYARAERALEVLSITAPSSLSFADGPLLQADLSLRAGEYDKALELYEGVRAEYDPLARQVADFISGHLQPGAYYDELVSEDLGGEAALPTEVLEWVRDEAKERKVFAVLDDMHRARRLARESRTLVRRLRVALTAPSRVKAFPEVKAALERAVALMNRLATIDHALGSGMDGALRSPGSGEMRELRERRRSLMDAVRGLPKTSADFAQRDATAVGAWNVVGQKLQGLRVEADRLAALSNGLERILRSPGSYPGAQSPAAQQRIAMELGTVQGELATYRRAIEQYREWVDDGRLRVGFGDETFARDEALRREFRVLVRREYDLFGAGAGGPAASEYARVFAPVVSRSDRAFDYLDGVKQELEAQVAELSQDLMRMVETESSNVEDASVGLETLDGEARALVGQAAMESFRRVAERLRVIVLRADVGIFQQSWEIRDAQRERVRNLQRERAREEKLLSEELRDVLDYGEAKP